MKTRGRGRPPHPDILTPREWEVLQLIEEGLTNEQIGQRLGISSDGAKFHVAQILSKLGVSSRHEAPSIAYANRGRVVRRWAFLPFFGKLGASKTANTIAAGGVVAASVIALIALFFALRGQATEPFDMYPGLYVLDLSSGKVNRLVDLRPGDGRRVEWTKDGSGLLMLQSVDPPPANSTKLRLFDAETGALLAEDKTDDTLLSYSRLGDGRLGAVYHREERADNGTIIASTITGILEPASMLLEARRAISGTQSVYESYWSPDGNVVITQGPSTGPTDPLAEDFRLYDLRSATPPVATQVRFWSPDGTRYITPLQDPIPTSLAEVRDSATNELLATIDFGPDSISGADALVLWSPDSRWILNAGHEDLFLVPSDGSAAPRSLAKGSFYYTRFNRDAAGPGWPTWSPDSRSIAFLDDDNVLQRVDIASGIIEPLYEPPLPFLAEPRWSPDGTKIAFRVADTPSIHVATLKGESDYVASGNLGGVSPRGDRLSLSYGPNIYTIKPNGRSLTALSDFDNSYLVFTDRMGSCFIGPKIESAAWSPDGKWLLHTRMNENDLDVDVTVRVRSNRFAPDEGSVLFGSSLTWSPNAKVTAHRTPSPSFAPDPSSHSCSVVLTDVASGQIMVQLPGSSYEWVGEDDLLVQNMGTSTLVGPDGTIIRTFEDRVVVSPKVDVALQMPWPASNPTGEIVLVDIASGDVLRRFPGVAQAATISLDGRYLILTTTQSDIYDLTTGELVRTLPQSTLFLFSPDGRTLAYRVNASPPASLAQPVPPPAATPVDRLFLLNLVDPAAAPQEVTLSRSVREMVWSPESTHLAITTSDSPTRGPSGVVPPASSSELLIVERSTLKQTHIADNASRVEWFPDGRRLVYQGD